MLSCSDIGEMIDSQIIKRRQMERKYLIDIMKCLKFHSRQGIPLQSHDNNDNLTFASSWDKDDNITKHIHGQIGHKYTHNDIQNELLSIISSHVLCAKLSTIRERKFFSIMADERTEVSNIEQLSFCTGSLDDDLNVSEDFMRFHDLKNNKSETTVNAIKDILLISHLSLENCCGQTYGGASNMMGKRSGVSFQISAEQQKAMTTRCQGHSLSLAIKSLTKDCTILRNTLGTVGEICVLVKHSPKREKMLESIMENTEGEFEEQPKTDHPSKLDKLCVTRWTVRGKCFKKILDNYEPFLQLLEKSLKGDLNFETKSRIIGCKIVHILFRIEFEQKFVFNH